MHRKVFRIEQFQRGGARPAWNGGPAPAESGQEPDAPAARRHREVLDAIAALRGNTVNADGKATDRLLADYKSQINEARKLKSELDEMYEAITRTKKEIATLHVTGFKGPEMARVTDELDAIVQGTEMATETILGSAEEIDQLAHTLASHLKKEANQGMADDILQNVIKIFEACNFQDLTGQRISKVVNTLRFIEERIVRMMDIWGGIDGFADVEPEQVEQRTGDAALLNGPALDTDIDTASQDDIDALFS